MVRAYSHVITANIFTNAFLIIISFSCYELFLIATLFISYINECVYNIPNYIKLLFNIPPISRDLRRNTTTRRQSGLDRNGENSAGPMEEEIGYSDPKKDSTAVKILLFITCSYGKYTTGPFYH